VTNANDDQRPVTPGHDRRAFLQRAGIGAVAVGAWVAPQVLFTDVASAGCTPITKMLQITAASCGAVSPTSPNPNLVGCVPPGWVNGRTDGVTFTCVPTVVLLGSARGSVVTVTLPGCGPTAARAVKMCPSASGSIYTCVSVIPVGATVTFPTLSFGELAAGCVYVDFRITVTCCT